MATQDEIDTHTMGNDEVSLCKISMTVYTHKVLYLVVTTVYSSAEDIQCSIASNNIFSSAVRLSKLIYWKVTDVFEIPTLSR